MKATLLASLGLSLVTCQMSAILKQKELKILPDSFTELNFFSQDLTGEIKEGQWLGVSLASQGTVLT